MNQIPLSPVSYNQQKVTLKSQPQFLSQPQSTVLKSALIGSAITILVSWNAGRYSRIGTFLKRWRFIRHFVSPKTHFNPFLITNYHYPHLSTVSNNFYCYSGQPGIGKSYHFQLLTAKQSLIRPALYISFKSLGRDSNFSNDLAEQLNFGEDEPTGMITEMIRAINKIQYINKNPNKFQLRYMLTNLTFIGFYYLIFNSQFAQILKIGLSSLTFFWQIYYINLMGPIFRQSLRKTIPVIVFDDLNKIQQINMLPEIVRFLKPVEQEAVNIILSSSDQQTWSRLRREPGMKDRLRLRQIKYDYIEAANRINQVLDKSHDSFRLHTITHPMYSKEVIKTLVRDLIALRQMSIRRFIGVLRLVDEEFYESFIQILKNPNNLSVEDVANALREVMFNSQAETMVSNLKIIKRSLDGMSMKEFLESLELLLKKQKLAEDNKIGSILKLYNIVRDLRSEYVINGRYTYIIYQRAYQKYIEDIKEYEELGQQKNNDQ